MDLLNRYLHAVRFWLPKSQQEDIVAELGEDLRSQIEDREAALGRKLDEREIEAILDERGRPSLVASRYLPQQYLIGPVFLTFYRFGVKWIVLPFLIVIRFEPSGRAYRYDESRDSLPARSTENKRPTAIGSPDPRSGRAILTSSRKGPRTRPRRSAGQPAGSLPRELLLAGVVNAGLFDSRISLNTPATIFMPVGGPPAILSLKTENSTPGKTAASSI
jgi:hypothetical protein